MWLLQNEPEFRFLEKLTEAKGRRSQNWERSASDRLGKQGLDEFKALQADSDDCELAIRFDRHSAKMAVRQYLQNAQTGRFRHHAFTHGLVTIRLWERYKLEQPAISRAAHRFGKSAPD